jgi:hypothetical protein
MRFSCVWQEVLKDDLAVRQYFVTGLLTKEIFAVRKRRASFALKCSRRHATTLYWETR